MYVHDEFQGNSFKNDWVMIVLYFVCFEFGNIAAAVEVFI